MAIRISNPAIQHFDKSTGAQLAGGQMFFFETNSTTPKDVFDEAAATTPLTNPVILDGNGFEPNIFGEGSYRIVLQNSDGVQQWERDPVDFETETGAFSDWLASISYGVNDIVQGSDGNFYVSISGTDNINKDPTISPTFWSQFDLLNRWNTNENYQVDDVVRGSDGIIYTAINAQSGNDPTLDTSATNWKMFDNIRIDGNTISATNTNGDVELNPEGDGNITSFGVNIAQVTRQIFTATGQSPYTKPTGCKFIDVEVLGAGGGGGGTDNGNAFDAAGGGGAGSYQRSVIDVTTLSATVDFVIGTGGTGVSQSDGNDGTSTIFNSGTPTAGVPVITSTGGGGGLDSGAAGTGYPYNGGTGATGGQLIIPGGSGSAPVTASASALSGVGGGSYYGGGAPGVFVVSVNPNRGEDAQVPGTGGSGAQSLASGGLSGDNRTGGTGADGLIVVTEYY